jgi:hypothetical protein
METQSKPFVYIPLDAKINVENKDLLPPKTEYDKRQKNFSREEIKKQVTKKDIP